MDNPWICIARTGTFQDSQGRDQTFTLADLENIRAAYNPAKSEAPLVLGHPKDNAPAYGWVTSLKTKGQELFAQVAHVPAAIKKLVQDRAYRYVSMSLASDKKRLLHVGLLGAAAPAIDGLGPVAFEADGITINFSAPEQEAEHTGGTMNPEELLKQIAELQKQLAEARAENERLKGEKGASDKGKEEAEAKVAAVASEFSAYKDKITTDARAARGKALVKAGKLEPAKLAETLSFAAALAKVETPVNFAAADGTTETITAEERHFRELEARQPAALSVDFSTFVPPTHSATNQTPAYDPSAITSKL